ncbi:AAA family ATPase [Shewanella sp. WXL01]|uniref:AAA family ATPase n=1 Tax=Shewanella sp. WXL01 TaxID=2709721 RepID=UPI0014382ADE|nr:AAA family ATPase [Shewanella sp. WXL01]NKF48994.1 AAA family ATPase [Shewanella sp. WXL01]
MDKSVLQNLQAALSQSPENIVLRLSIAQAYFEKNEFESSVKLIDELQFNTFDEEQQLLASNIFLAANRPKSALAPLCSNSPETNLQRSKVYYALDDLQNAKKFYEKAICENPALEDIEYARQVESKGVYASPDNLVKLRVISNDDTNDTEITRLIKPADKNISFVDVGGLEEVKKQIRKKIITPFQKPSLFSKFRKKVGGGILFYGPPGCGKTMLARATAGECNASFYNVAISDILDMYIGESERKLHAIFEEARANTPAVIFFDEVEALAAKRQNTREATSSKLVSLFLSELDGFAQDNQGVLILGATNVPWALDSAFRRPGRFDRVVFIAPPDQQARAEIIKGLLDGRPGADSINVSKLAKQTSGFSGADLMNVIESAVDEAIDESIEKEEEVPLNEMHVKEAIRVCKATTSEWLTTARNYARYSNDAGQYDDVLAFIKKNGS